MPQIVQKIKHRGTENTEIYFPFFSVVSVPPCFKTEHAFGVDEATRPSAAINLANTNPTSEWVMVRVLTRLRIGFY